MTKNKTTTENLSLVVDQFLHNFLGEFKLDVPYLYKLDIKDDNKKTNIKISLFYNLLHYIPNSMECRILTQDLNQVVKKLDSKLRFSYDPDNPYKWEIDINNELFKKSCKPTKHELNVLASTLCELANDKYDDIFICNDISYSNTTYIIKMSIIGYEYRSSMEVKINPLDCGNLLKIYTEDFMKSLADNIKEYS